MKVLVCGGRDFNNWEFLKRELDRLHEQYDFTKLIHGAAPGADTLAGTWAATRSIPVQHYIAFWKSEGRAAGPKRNQRMLDEEDPDLVVAFPGGAGTFDMVSRALRANKKVIQYNRAQVDAFIIGQRDKDPSWPRS